MRSHAGTEGGSEADTVKAGALNLSPGSAAENNVGLTVRLQQKLDKVQKEKDLIERKCDELETKAAANPNNEKQTVDMTRVRRAEQTGQGKKRCFLTCLFMF